MSTSQIFAAIDALYGIATTVLPASSVDVHDGPIAIQSPSKDYLLIGCDAPQPTGTQVAGVDSQSDWAGLGALHRDETFTIHNSYVAWSPDPTFTASRARAAANVGLIENALRTGAGMILNGAVNQPGWVALDITRVMQVNDGNGIQVHVLFGVVCRGRI